MENENPLVEPAFAVIMAAGDARDHCNKALAHARKGEFEAAASCMAEARTCIAQAHGGQTDIIQAETRGEKHEICLLFIHAQDTLMTIMSELNMASEMIEMYKLIYGREQKSI